MAVDLDEPRLAYAAVDGDGDAFGRLYDAYERRIFAFCQRLVGTPEEAADCTQEAFLRVLQRLPDLQGRDLRFGAYLFTAARNACYDAIEKRKRAEAVDEIPEHGVQPLLVDERAAAVEDPEKAAMIGSLRSAVQQASARLPERQREVLALRELEELSYDDIAGIMGMNRNSVAQLISRARLRLRDELRGSALRSVAVSSPDCERALPLIAMRQDGQLTDPAQRAWLRAHLGACSTCQVAVDAMEEAGLSYRAWLPALPLAGLFEATAAAAAELTGSDWSDVIARRAAARAGGSVTAATGAAATQPQAAAAHEPAGGDGDEVAGRPRRGRRRAVALAALLLLLGAATAVVAGDDEPATPVAPPATAGEETPASTATATTAGEGSAAARGASKRSRRATAPAGTTAGAPPVVPVTAPLTAARTGAAPAGRRRARRLAARRRPPSASVPAPAAAPRPNTGTTPAATSPAATPPAPGTTHSPPATQPPPASTELPPRTTEPPPRTTEPPPTGTQPARCSPNDARCCRRYPEDPGCGGQPGAPPTSATGTRP